jgi:selenocysteine lyase/cysteine desulfurase
VSTFQSPAEALDAYQAESGCPDGYLDFARFGPLLRSVASSVRRALRITEHEPHHYNDLAALGPAATRLVSELTGFSQTQIALSPNTSSALFQVAFALPPGELLVSPFEFPANIHPWLRAERHGGPTVRWLETRPGATGVTPSSIRSVMTSDTVAVAVSAVDSAQGFTADLGGLRETVGDRLLLVDAIQGFGAVDLPWDAADVVATGGQKWLRAGWGTGFLACSERALDRLGDGLAGWTATDRSPDPNTINSFDNLRSDAQRFTMTSPDPTAAAGMISALEILARVGPDVIESRIRELVRLCRLRLEEAGAVIYGPLAPQARSGIVSFSVPGSPAQSTVMTLADEGITVSERNGLVRASLHASTTEDALDGLSTVVAKLARSMNTT